MIRDSGSMKVMMLIIPNDAKDDDDESPWMLLFCDSDYDDNANAYDVKVDGYDDGDDYDGDDGGQTGVARLRINNQPSANSFGNLIGIIK